MSPLKEVLLQIKTMTFKELEMVQTFLEVMMEVERPDKDLDKVKDIYSEGLTVGMKMARREASARQGKTLSPAKLAALAKATEASKAKALARKGRKRKRRALDDFPERAVYTKRVWEAMTQSSGWLTGTDLDELLSLPKWKGANTLSNLYRGRHGRYMERQKTKPQPGSDGRIRGFTYQYRYVGNGKEAQ